ncbi:MAG: LON peptidase substrate-binding domain-containing protein [Leptolinea sp.]|nr:LON peptidase substrate-binding domain-containing protein [Leptolinea sp.]
MPLHLHIFEERYRIMVRHILDHDGLLGIVLIHQGLEALGPLPEPYRVGMLARMVEYETLPDGRMNITVMGIDRFNILDIDTVSQPFLLGTVETSPIELPRMIQVHRKARQLSREILAYLKELSRDNTDEIDVSNFSPPDDPMSLVFLGASLLQIPPTEKQPILEAPSVFDMMDIVERLYRRENGLMRTINATGELPARRAAWLN